MNSVGDAEKADFFAAAGIGVNVNGKAIFAVNRFRNSGKRAHLASESLPLLPPQREKNDDAK